MLTALLVLVGVLALLWRVVFRDPFCSYWTRRGVAQVPLLQGLPVLLMSEFRGHVLQRWYREARAAGCACIGFHMATLPVLMPVDRELVRAVLVKDFDHFTDHGSYHNRDRFPLQANLFNLTGSEWRGLRAKLTPTFTSGKMRAMLPLVRECAAELDAHLRRHVAADPQGNVVEMFEVQSRFTTDVICSCALGVRGDALRKEDSRFRAAGKAFFDKTLFRAACFNVLGVVAPRLLDMMRANLMPIDGSEAFFTDMLRDNIAQREQQQQQRGDFVDLLLELKRAKAIDEAIVPAQAWMFFLAGFETSANTLGNCMTELSLHGDVQRRLREEVNRVLAKHGGEVTYEALQDMTYMDQVIEETMRLYPALHGLPRVVTKEYRLPGTKTVLEKGTRVIVPVYALHRDPEYFPEPDAFDPDLHFSPEAKRSRPGYVYMPFGDGPRICIGLRFAMMQMKTALCTILRSFEVAPCEEGLRHYPPRFSSRTFVTRVLGGNKVHVALPPAATS